MRREYDGALAGVQDVAVVIAMMAMSALRGTGVGAGLKPGHWDSCVVEDDASQRIVEREQEHDLVVVGKHGQSAAEELLLGSVTKHMLSEGSTDVLVSTAHTAPAAA